MYYLPPEQLSLRVVCLDDDSRNSLPLRTKFFNIIMLFFVKFICDSSNSLSAVLSLPVVPINHKIQCSLILIISFINYFEDDVQFANCHEIYISIYLKSIWQVNSSSFDSDYLSYGFLTFSCFSCLSII